MLVVLGVQQLLRERHLMRDNVASRRIPVDERNTTSSTGRPFTRDVNVKLDVV